MNRNRAIEEAIRDFAHHKATLRENTELGIQILDWQRPGTRHYKVRYVFDREGGTICISGDLGEAVIYPTWAAAFKDTVRAVVCGAHGVNEHYFLEKVSATSDRYEYDAADAVAELKSRCAGIDNDDLHMLMRRFDHHDGFTGLGDYEKSILDRFDDDWWDWIGGVGRSVHIRVYLWLVGLAMAWEQLHPANKGAAA